MAGRVSGNALLSLVIAALARREMYGYEVAQQIASIDEGTGLPEGSVYPALRRLEREGLVAARWVEIGENEPRRRYYVLTPKGQTVSAPLAGAGTRAARRTPRAVGS